MLTKGPWLWRMRGKLDLSFANYVEAAEGGDLRAIAGRMASLLDPSASWADVAWLRGLWRGPLLLKGVLHPDEARRAVAEGIDGIIVSNHGGRQLDGAAGDDRGFARHRGGGRGAGSPCCSTAASAAAWTSPGRWRWAPRPA